MILDVIPYVHWILSQNIKLGHTVVDATMGNGHDTLFLSKLVGATGKVYSFDIQPQAIERTKILLTKSSVNNSKLILDSHINFRRYLTKSSAFVYNLGYLPNGNKLMTTNAQNTLLSLQEAMQLLLPKGIISIVIYPGHPSGNEERLVLENYLKGISQANFEILRYQFVNHKIDAPYAILLQRVSKIKE